jgi:copper chaperone CopZ
MFKPLKLSCIIFAAAMFTFAFSYSVVQASCTVCEDVEKHPKTKDVTLNVKGMTCGGCESKVKKVLSAQNGVSDVKVSHKDSKAELHLEDGKASVDDLIKAVKKLGYKVTEG